MPRAIDVSKVLQAAGESKALNLNLTLKEVASSSLFGAVGLLDEPWDLICADWVTLIRRGPRFDSVLEAISLANTIKDTVGSIKGGVRG
jgi:hypothetical protein